MRDGWRAQVSGSDLVGEDFMAEGRVGRHDPEASSRGQGVIFYFGDYVWGAAVSKLGLKQLFS